MAAKSSVFSRIRRVGSRLLGALVGGLLGLIAGPIFALLWAVKNFNEMGYGFVAVAPAMLGIGVVFGLLGGLWEGGAKGLLAGIKIPLRCYQQAFGVETLNQSLNKKLDTLHHRQRVCCRQYQQSLDIVNSGRVDMDMQSNRNNWYNHHFSKLTKQLLCPLTKEELKHFDTYLLEQVNASESKQWHARLKEYREYIQYDFPITMEKDGRREIFEESTFMDKTFKEMHYTAAYNPVGLLAEVKAPASQYRPDDIKIMGFPESVIKTVIGVRKQLRAFSETLLQREDVLLKTQPGNRLKLIQPSSPGRHGKFASSQNHDRHLHRSHSAPDLHHSQLGRSSKK